jgi:hypothetical protein
MTFDPARWLLAAALALAAASPVLAQAAKPRIENASDACSSPTSGRRARSRWRRGPAPRRW